ncbi:MAG: TSUP family transporter [Kineosporiaceae bacterium]
MTALLVAAEVAAGVVIGAVVGLLGGGGAILTLPTLVLVFGVDPRGATTTSLAVVAVAALVGLAVHGRAGLVSWRMGGVVGGLGTVAAVGGSLLSAAVPGQVLLIVFAGLLVVAGVTMLRPRREAPPGPPPRTRRLPVRVAVVLVAAGIGLVTGFLGVGGGFLVVPALVLLLGVPMNRAVGTSLLVLLVNALAGLGTRLVVPFPGVDLTVTLLVTAGAAVGAVAGALVSHRLPATALRRLFGGLVLAVAVATLVQALRGG